MKLLKIIVLFITLPAVVSAAEYTPAGNCGSAKVIEGNTCSNVKVEFNFEGCDLKSQNQIAKKIICKGTTIKARLDENNLRYEASFDKVDGGWGDVQWKPQGPVRQWQKKVHAKAPHTTPAQVTKNEQPEPTRAPAAAQPAPFTERLAEPTTSPFKFSGFIDLRYTAFRAGSDLTGNYAGHPESGFNLEDGALYGNYEKGKMSVIADVAFRRGKEIDIVDGNATPTSTPQAPNQSVNSNFGIGVDKSQLYIKYRLTDEVTIDFGQWDTALGVELNDSKDRIFGKTGMVFDNFIPNTQTGLMIEYTKFGAYVKGFAVNPNGKGSYGKSSTGDENTEYGGVLGYSNELIHGQVGYMARPMNKYGTTGRGNRQLFDALVGTTYGRFALDLEYSHLSDPSKDGFTSGVADLEKAAQGYMLLTSYKFTDDFLAGLRVERITDLVFGTTAIKSGQSYGTSLHYKLSNDLELRTDYLYYQFQKLDDSKWIDTRFTFSALVTF